MDSPYASHAEAWNDALEKAAQIVERYNAAFSDPEAGGAPGDIRALKRDLATSHSSDEPDGSPERPFPPEMLPRCASGDAEVIVCVGDCGNTPPCALCVHLNPGDDPDQVMRPV